MVSIFPDSLSMHMVIILFNFYFFLFTLCGNHTFYFLIFTFKFLNIADL